MFTRRNFVEKFFALITVGGLAPGCLAAAPLKKKETGGGPSDKDEDLLKILELLKGKEPLKWVFAGDSITQGAKHTKGYRSYPEIFAERVRWEMRRVRDIIINSAISGNTSRDILNDYDWRIGQFNPSVVSIFAGTNDASVSKKLTTEEFRQNIVTIIKKVRDGGAIPILHTPTITITEKATGRETLPDYVKVIREVSREAGVVLVDNWEYWTKQMETLPSGQVYRDWLNDELHPNGKGHLEIAQLIFKKLSIFDPLSFTGGTIPFQ